MSAVARRLRWATGVLMGVVLAGTAAAALEPAPELQVDVIETAGYPSVRAIVVPPRELSVDAIRQGTFIVLEGGQKREATVETLPSKDLAVVLVIDTSGSMKGDAILQARSAAASFVAAMPADTRLAVVGFGTVAKVHSPFTTDRTKTLAALASLRVRGQTALHDALVTGSKLFEDVTLPPGSRRVIVVLSDGGDTASKATLGDASRALNTAGVSVSAIALATRESDTAALKLLTSSAGGAMAPAADPAALKGVFDGVASSVLRQYQLRWTSTASGTSDITLELASGGKTWRAVRAVSFPTLTTVPPASVVPSPSPTPTPAPVPVPAPVLRIGTAESGSRWLYTGLGAGFLAALLAIGVVVWPRPPRRRLAAELGLRPHNEVSGFSKGLIRATRTYFRRHGRGRRLASLLERAGMTMDAPTAAVLAGAIGLCSMALGLVLDGVALAFVLGIVTLSVGFLLLKSRADRRSTKFRDQFESSLQIIISSLKSGYGISQAIGTVAREAEAPTSDEFRRIVAETTLGMDQIQALEACAKRTGCDELLWVAESMEVNRDVGGNLADVLVGIATTIRSRIRLARQVQAIASEGRLSAQILLAMPILGFIYRALVTRKALGLMFSGAGLVVLIGGAVCMVIGYVWTRRIVAIRY